jgi:hypothetical protein
MSKHLLGRSSTGTKHGLYQFFGHFVSYCDTKSHLTHITKPELGEDVSCGNCVRTDTYKTIERSGVELDHTWFDENADIFADGVYDNG